MIAAADQRRRLIEAHLPLARRVARRYAGRGERPEDLAQVGALALVRAVDRCDPSRPELPAYLARCVEGEIRHHLRDRTSAVRLPRHGAAQLQAAQPQAAAPLDDQIACPKAALDEALLDRAAVASAARCLDDRERWIVLLLFFCDCTQADAASRLGLSQAHVSRLLGGAIAKMRRRLESPPLSRPKQAATLRGDGHSHEQAGDKPA
jgi:RNA polymerase sigma-B factor